MHKAGQQWADGHFAGIEGGIQRMSWFELNAALEIHWAVLDKGVKCELAVFLLQACLHFKLVDRLAAQRALPGIEVAEQLERDVLERERRPVGEAEEVEAPLELPQGRDLFAAEDPLVMFEAVGVPGVIDQAMRAAPQRTEIVVVGVCMETDQLQPFMGITKELTVKFSMAYDPMEFASTLQTIADGGIDVSPMITGTVGIDDVPQAFADLASPDTHAKIVVEP